MGNDDKAQSEIEWDKLTGEEKLAVWAKFFQTVGEGLGAVIDKKLSREIKKKCITPLD